ncbi:MAG: methyltransferase domain-containing protein, partial [Halobacteriaceae archaeon]
MTETEPFGEYARYYDLLYRDKDYGEECNFIENTFESYADFPVKTLLDCACGTANHAIRLANRGKTVKGFDQSQTMIDEARGKVD